MTTEAIRQKLYEYIRVADEKKVKAIFTMVEGDIKDYEWENDEVFVAEMEKRSSDYKTGKVKGIPWEEAKKQILSSSKKKRA